MGVQTVRTENFPKIFPEKNKIKESPSSPFRGIKKKVVQGRRLKMKPFRGKVSVEGCLLIIYYFCTCA